MLGNLGMRLPIGSVNIKKTVEEVYSFTTNLNELAKHASLMNTDEYEFEFVIEAEELIEKGMIVPLLCWAIYEGDKDYVINLEFVEVIENQLLIAKIESIGAYENDEGDDPKYLPLESSIGCMALATEFHSLPSGVKVKQIITVESDFKILKFLMFLVNFMSYFSARKHFKKWGAVVESHA